jgi:signal transduction histidine kinase
MMELVREFHESLHIDTPPAEMLTRGVEIVAEIADTYSIIDRSLPAWGWVLEPIFDLPSGWSTPGSDAEGAAKAREHFNRKIEPTVIAIPAATTILALPVPGNTDGDADVAGAMIAVPLEPDAEIGEFALRRFATATRLIGMQMENSTRGRAGRRALQLAQLTARAQQALVAPTELPSALRLALDQFATFDEIIGGKVTLVEGGDEIDLADFGEMATPTQGGETSAVQTSATQAAAANGRASTHVEFPVMIDGNCEAMIRLHSRHPLGITERDILASVAIVVAGTAVRHRASETIESLRRSTTRRLVEAQERERSVIAADIHDGVLQQLGATAIRLELAQSRVDQQDFAAARTIIADGAEEIRSCARELRGLLMELRPQVLDDNGINAALSELGRHVVGVKVEVDSSLPEDLGSEFAITVFRIVQEALTNIEKHAQAKNAKVVVALEKGRVMIDIQDDGIGYEGSTTGPSAEGSHLGLLGMRERAQMFGGSFSISGVSGEGTSLRAELPLARPQQADTEDLS